jgi:hypothetical protein
MWYSYTVEECFDEAVKGIRDTLTHHCEKDVRIEMPLGPNHPAWFMAVKGAGKSGGEVRAKGASGVCDFRFCADNGGAVIHVKNYPGAKRIFLDFAAIIQSYRKINGLEALKDDYLYSERQENEPGVTESNYTAITDTRFDDFRDTLHSKFSGLSVNMKVDRYDITVYAKNDDDALPPGASYPPERKLFMDFKRIYSFDDVVYLAIKTYRDCYTYFSVKGIGLFYNNENAGREFLERKHSAIARLLTIMPNSNMIKQLDEAKSGVTKYDLGYRRINEGEYRLFINQKETGMRIFALYPVTQSDDDSAKPSGPPLFWAGEGGGGKEWRSYRSLNAAFQGEKALIDRAFVNGEIGKIINNEELAINS